MGDHHTLSQTNKPSTVDDLTATATLDQFHDNTDPKYIGPGVWNMIHKRAFKARSISEQKDFIKFMNETCNEFPCTVCRGHCQEYIKNNPLTDYLDTSIDIDGVSMKLGMFLWSWKFHNAVNHRLSKPVMSWDTAYNLYSDSESLVCSKACMNSALPPPPNVPDIKIGSKSPFRLIKK